jgi:cell division protein FtsQ
VRGGHLDYEGSKWLMLPGKAAGLVGLAAEDITITGLEHHEPEMLLAAIGVQPGASLIGFDAGRARRILEGLDWIESAKVQRLFPNQLAVEVKEREPFAIWQRGEAYYVIDRTGSAMSGLAASKLVRLPLVTGEGANTAAADLINQLSAYPDILLQMKAAARVGKRRWTLYLDSGITVQLPERDWQDALRMADELNRTQQLLSRGIRSVDLRLAGRVIVEVAELDQSELDAMRRRRRREPNRLRSAPGVEFGGFRAMTVVQFHGKGGGKPPAVTKGGLIAALDIGSTKISCLIAEAVPAKHRSSDAEEKHSLKVLGVGHQLSRGVRSGAIINVDEAERAIRLAVDAAERMAQRTINEVYVNVSGGRPQSRLYTGTAATASGQVNRTMRTGCWMPRWRRSIPAAATSCISRRCNISSTTPGREGPDRHVRRNAVARSRRGHGRAAAPQEPGPRGGARPSLDRGLRDRTLCGRARRPRRGREDAGRHARRHGRGHHQLRHLP